MEDSLVSGLPQQLCSAFPPTQWTVVAEAASADPARARVALEQLCANYRPAIVAWFRRKDFQRDPEDLAQSFLAYFLSQNILQNSAGKFAARSGRFRTFLAVTMQNFLHDTWDRELAQKRGGGTEVVSLDADELDPADGSKGDSRLDVDFALLIHGRVMAQLRPGAELRRFIFEKDAPGGWEALAAGLGRTSAAVRKEVSRMRDEHWQRFRNEVAQTVAVAERDGETRYLYKLLFDHAPAE